jgi:hypothetical protein
MIVSHCTTDITLDGRNIYLPMHLMQWHKIRFSNQGLLMLTLTMLTSFVVTLVNLLIHGLPIMLILRGTRIWQKFKVFFLDKGQCQLLSFQVAQIFLGCHKLE